MKIDPAHIENAARARELYLHANEPEVAAERWREHYRLSRKRVEQALKASDRLRDVAKALEEDGNHMAVFRQILAPPASQAQFRLLCPEYSVRSENDGRPLAPDVAAAMERVVLARINHGLVPWLRMHRIPKNTDIAAFAKVVSTLMAVHKDAVGRRNGLSFDQENTMLELLASLDCIKIPSKSISSRNQIANRHFMYKTSILTGGKASVEIDIVCGLEKSYVLALECKVSNDETNSARRIDDVLNKAAAWKKRWGGYICAAALLRGVIAPRDVQRLAEAGVHIFWSHDLDAFTDWLIGQT